MNINLKAILAPKPSKAREYKVYSLGLTEAVLPLAIMARAQGLEGPSQAAIGCPVETAKDKEGNVLFTKDGFPRRRVAKELKTFGKLTIEYVSASIQGTVADFVATEEGKQAYAVEAEACRLAGEPVKQAMTQAENLAVAQRVAAEAAKVGKATTKKATVKKTVAKKPAAKNGKAEAVPT